MVASSRGSIKSSCQPRKTPCFKRRELKRRLNNWFRVLDALPEYSGPGGSSQWPVSPAPGDTMPSSGLRDHLHTHSIQTHRHTHIQRNEIILKKNVLKRSKGKE